MLDWDRYAEARSAETDFEDADDTASSIYCKAKKEDASSDSWAEGPVYERAVSPAWSVSFGNPVLCSTLSRAQ